MSYPVEGGGFSGTGGAGCCRLLGDSPGIAKVRTVVHKVARTSSTVLVLGESGTGKELVARAIHNLSPRSDGPFVAVNCGAIPVDLAENEFFGHDTGAFTGASHSRAGKIEQAGGGTFFLDEVSTLPHRIQVKLLRVLQERTVERLGGNRSRSVDTRVVAATNEDLGRAVRDGRFREDLYYRLNVVPVLLPPLRERKEDIPCLVEHFLARCCRKYGKAIRGLDDGAMRGIIGYRWPGNVRELENCVERLVVLGEEGRPVTAKDLPPEIRAGGKAASGKGPLGYGTDLTEATSNFERSYISNILSKAGWNRSLAAQRLGIHRNTLMKKIKDLAIEIPVEEPA